MSEYAKGGLIKGPPGGSDSVPVTIKIGELAITTEGHISQWTGDEWMRINTNIEAAMWSAKWLAGQDSIPIPIDTGDKGNE